MLSFLQQCLPLSWYSWGDADRRQVQLVQQKKQHINTQQSFHVITTGRMQSDDLELECRQCRAFLTSSSKCDFLARFYWQVHDTLMAGRTEEQNVWRYFGEFLRCRACDAVNLAQWKECHNSRHPDNKTVGLLQDEFVWPTDNDYVSSVPTVWGAPASSDSITCFAPCPCAAADSRWWGLGHCRHQVMIDIRSVLQGKYWWGCCMYRTECIKVLRCDSFGCNRVQIQYSRSC
jgi:hypothetical protein